MDELDFPDFGGESASVAPFGRDCGCGYPLACGCGSLERCVYGGFVLGTELGLAIEDCDGIQVEITL